MNIKELHRCFNVFLLATFSLIATPVDQTSQQDFHFIQTEFVQKRQISQEDFLKAIASLSTQDTQKVQPTTQTKNKPLHTQSTEKIESQGLKIQDIVQFARSSNLKFRKALLDKLIQTKQILNTQARRVKQSVFNTNPPLQTVPVITSTDTIFALAAGAVIVEKIVVVGATVATGAFVGSNHDPKNCPIAATPPHQAATARYNIQPIAASHNTPTQTKKKNIHPTAKNNSQIATPCGSTKTSKPQKTNPGPKTKASCSSTAQSIAATPCSDSRNKRNTHNFYNPTALDLNQIDIESDAQKARASHAQNMTANQDSGINTSGKFGAASLGAAGLTVTGSAGAIVAGGVIVGYGIAKTVKKRKEFHENHPEYKSIKRLVKEEEQHRKSIFNQEKEEFKRILQEAQLSFKEIKKQKKKPKQNNVSKPSNSDPNKDPDKDPKKDTESKIRGGRPKDPKAEVKFLELLKRSSKREAFTQRFGKFYQDAKTKLWWSQDNAVHSGPHYKVYKETAKGFQWLYDADTLGQKIIDKHKGPVGRFIPYSEIKFLS